jgi:virginiamycin B lyase
MEAMRKIRALVAVSTALVALATAMLFAPRFASAALPPGAEGKGVEFALGEGSLPQVIALGPDGNLWFTLDHSLGPDEIGRLVPTGELTTFAVPSTMPAGASQVSLEGITTGTDGNLWFTGQGGEGATIGSISTAGQVSLVPLAHPARFPTTIAAGPGGRLWFTSSGRQSDSWIGELEPDGQVREFLQRSAFTEGITAGPEGNMWFLGASTTSRPSAGQVGRITPAGKVSRFPVPGAEGVPQGIAASGGRIWFGVETEEPAIASVDRGGRIRELPLPAPSGGASGYVNSIVPARGGGVWFVGNIPQIFGRVSADGEVRRTLLQSDATFHRGLAMGPEGNLWATSSGGLLRIEPRIPGARLRQLGALGPRGPVRVRVECERGPDACRGTLRLSHQRTSETCCGAIRVAFARYRIPGGETKVVAIEPGRAGRAELRRAARHGHFVTVGAFEPGGFAASRLLRVTGVGVVGAGRYRNSR